MAISGGLQKNISRDLESLASNAELIVPINSVALY
jgi:hypothetical protein